MNEETLREKLLAELDEVDAAALLPHHRRGALIIAAPSLGLIDAAVAVATDDADRVQAMIAGALLAKPTLAEMADWCMQPGLSFRFVIVQPFVLAQPLG